MADNDEAPRLQGNLLMSFYTLKPTAAGLCNVCVNDLRLFVPAAIPHVSSHHLPGERGTQTK